jgi:hypothetical protein
LGDEAGNAPARKAAEAAAQKNYECIQHRFQRMALETIAPAMTPLDVH